MDLISSIPIYWINLAKCIGRKQKMIDQLKSYNIEKNICIEAIDGNTLDLKNIQNINKFETACTLSHIKAIETAYNNNENYAIIMEDDCSFDYFKYHNTPILELFFKYNDCEILQLAICCRNDHNIKISQNENLIKKGHRDCATAYIINKVGMKKVINKYKNGTNLDLSEKFIYEGVNVYYLTKPYFTYYYSNVFKTTVHLENNQYNYSREDSSKKFWDNFYQNIQTK